MYTVVFRLHALQRMFSRGISDSDVEVVLKIGQVIESYENDLPYPSYLILGRSKEKVIHVVFAVNEMEKQKIIITAYEPDPLLWDSNYKVRRKV